jgi:CubicO group peptidase (beta-lactamase class C family)
MPPKSLRAKPIQRKRIAPESVRSQACPLMNIRKCFNSITEFFQSLATVTPIGLPYHTPEYSNTAFLLLAYALEGITNKTYDQAFEETLAKPLKLSQTFLHTPPKGSDAIISFNDSTSLFSWDLGDASP